MPSILAPQLDKIPDVLKTLPQWVLWEGTLTHDRHGQEKITKIPYTVRFRKASSTDPRTWTTYERVLTALPLALEEWAEGPTHLGGGIGFVFTPDDPYIGVDLDHARDTDTGAITPWAREILDTLDTYTEVSISGTGLHALCAGVWPPGHNQKGDVQIYHTARFFTMSGQHLSPYPRDIMERQEAIEAVHARLFPPPVPKASPKPRLPVADTLDENAIILKATKAKNGGKFRTLWSGDWSDYASESEADQALCSLLAFWTQESTQLDSLFRQSGLFRDKWDERRGAEQTYGSRTIAYALEHLGARYDPSRQHDTPPRHTPALWHSVNMALLPQALPENEHPNGAERRALSSHTPQPQAVPLRCDKQDHPYPDAGNFQTVFTHYPPWKKRLWWDTFGQVPMHQDDVLDDAAISNIAAWCGHTLQMSVRSEDQLRRSLYAVCKATPRDPLQEFVQSLTWDGIPRLDGWLHTYCGTTDTPAHRWIGITLCCALVARALTPGCMQRYCVILEGGENIGKSAVVRILGHPWARTLSRGVETKDAQMLLRGCWIMEVPELDSFYKSEESRIKAFVTDPTDTIILKYENSPTTYKRRTILIGTVNPDGNGYLKGQTGNTRYLPVLCTQIDLAGLEQDRNQLYAEAKEKLEHGYCWWEEPEGIDLNNIRETRRDTDVYEGLVAEWLDDIAQHQSLETITMQEVMQRALKIEEPEHWKDRALQTRIGLIVKRCGWTRFLRRDGKKLLWMYKKEEITQNT